MMYGFWRTTVRYLVARGTREFEQGVVPGAAGSDRGMGMLALSFIVAGARVRLGEVEY